MHDIYDPPPVPPVDWDPPRTGAPGLLPGRPGLPGRAVRRAAGHRAPGLAERTDPRLISAGAGALVILESWFTALGFLHRCPPVSLKLRWTIFLAALVPWLVGLGFAVCLMLCLFWISDHLG